MSIIVPNQNIRNQTAVQYNLVDSKNLLLIFTRNPVLGKCKTRLAATIGDEAALEVYKFLLGHTVNITKGVSAIKQVYYSEKIWPNDVWSADFYDKRIQKGNDLGIRMANAFQDGFSAGFKKIIVIGSDMFDLAKSDIENAFDLLEENDFVIGPAVDGGYYLLGMKKFKPELFEGKPWGTESVLSDTLKDLMGEKLALQEERNDIDLYEDIRENKAFQPFIKHLKK